MALYIPHHDDTIGEQVTPNGKTLVNQTTPCTNGFRIHTSSTHRGCCNSFSQVGRPTGRYHQLKPPTPIRRRHLHSHIDLEQSGHCLRMESCLLNGKYHEAQCHRGKLPTCDALGGSLPPDMPHSNSPSRCMQHSTYTLSHLRS